MTINRASRLRFHLEGLEGIHMEFSDDLNTVSCYTELFQTPGDGYSSSLVYTTCYYDSEQPIRR